MMQLANGQWALLAGNKKNDPQMKQWMGYEFRLVGVVAGGRISPRWCKVVC